MRVRALVERLVREKVKISIFSKVVSGWTQSRELMTNRRKLMANETRGIQNPISGGRQFS